MRSADLIIVLNIFNHTQLIKNRERAVINQTVTLIKLTIQPPKVSLSAETFHAHNAVEAPAGEGKGANCNITILKHNLQ